MKGLMVLAVIIALGSVGYMLGGDYITSDPEMGARVGALAGVLFGLLIYMAARTQS